ncbi:MAG TPA: hypothetical protein DCQ52_18030, partial [Acidimicrobiaceae bacterium]|nr:hypothetical protein [Acidimicrobiaceae bacterium]
MTLSCAGEASIRGDGPRLEEAILNVVLNAIESGGRAVRVVLSATGPVEIEVVDERTPQISVMTPQGVEEMGIDLPGMLPNLFGGPKKKKARLPVSEARAILVDREADLLSDEASVPQEAIRRAEETGIVFLDEI